jgi:hypothetical protein
MAELGMDALDGQDGQMFVDANEVHSQHEDELDCEGHVQSIDAWDQFSEEEQYAMCQAEREHRLGEEYIEHELLRSTLADSVDASSAGDVEMEVRPRSQPRALVEAMATIRHYEDTLSDALNKCSDAESSLREACVEIRELRAKLLVSESQTEHAQVTSSDTWLDLTASRWEAQTLREEVAMLNCQAEKLRTEMAKLEKDAEGSEQLLLEQLTAATATIALLEQQCTTAIKP